MRPRLLVIITFAGLFATVPLFAQPGPPEGAAPAMKELTKQERKHLRKSMKHRNLSIKHQQKAIRHQEIARMQRRAFRHERFGLGGPEMGGRPFMHRPDFSRKFDGMGPHGGRMPMMRQGPEGQGPQLDGLGPHGMQRIGPPPGRKCDKSRCRAN